MLRFSVPSRIVVPFILVFLLTAVPARAAWTERTATFIQGLSRDDGGFAFPDQAQSHLTPTFAAVGVQKLLGVETADAGKVGQFVRDNHPQRWKPPERALHEFDYQQIQTLLWLGQDPAEQFNEMVSGWTKPIPYMTRYETHGYPAFQQEVACLLSRELLKLPTDDLPNYLKYIQTRRRDNGSYNNTVPADDGSDGHVNNTLWALLGLKSLGQPIEAKAELVKWLQSCQRPEGHFAYAPAPPIGGKSNDVIYTWAAVQSLRMLDARPDDVAACVKYLHSLFNADGGFGDRPGWPSNSVATYYAVASLAALDALAQEIATPAKTPTPAPLPDGLKLFTAQIEAPGVGSPADAVEMARALKIDLWGAKNPKTEAWMAQAQKLADDGGVPVKFFYANEEYNTFFSVPGMGTYSHLVDVIAPVGVDFGKSMAGSKPVPTYDEFLKKRIVELERAGGRNVYQFNENECLARMLLDAAVDGDGAFAAISTFHFGNPNFINSSPYLWHFQHELPMVGMHDNHAAESWFWADQLTGIRTMFLAKEPTWEGLLDAFRNNRVVSVRHDEVSGGKLWIHGGDPATRERVMQEQADWQWWGKDAKLGQPMLALVPLTPQDTLEPGRPESGVALRIRRRWTNTAQGAPKTPTSELVSVTVDGKSVEAKRVAAAARQGKGKFVPANITDEYYLVELKDLAPGEHTATALVKATGSVPATGPLEQTVKFVVN